MKSSYNFYFCSSLYFFSKLFLSFLSSQFPTTHTTHHTVSYTPVKGAGRILSSRHFTLPSNIRMKTKRRKRKQSQNQNPSRSPSRCLKRVRRRNLRPRHRSQSQSRSSNFLKRSRQDRFLRKKRRRKSLRLERSH